MLAKKIIQAKKECREPLEKSTLPTLKNICIGIMADNFTKYPILKGLPKHIKKEVT
jgi:hypothetical protein